MLCKVNLPNLTYIIMEQKDIKKYFDEDSEIYIEELPDFELDKSQIKRHNNEFSTLVGALDAKWGHTYEPAEQPELTDEMLEELDRIVELQGKDLV